MLFDDEPQKCAVCGKPNCTSPQGKGAHVRIAGLPANVSMEEAAKPPEQRQEGRAARRERRRREREEQESIEIPAEIVVERAKHKRGPEQTKYVAGPERTK